VERENAYDQFRERVICSIYVVRAAGFLGNAAVAVDAYQAFVVATGFRFVAHATSFHASFRWQRRHSRESVRNDKCA
jgi:hypothetical protein